MPYGTADMTFALSGRRTAGDTYSPEIEPLLARCVTRVPIEDEE